MSRETLKTGRQTLQPKEVKNQGTVKDFVTGVAAGLAVVSGLMGNDAYSGERAAESIMIDKARAQIKDYVDKIASLHGFATDINDQRGCIDNLNAIKNILNINGLSIALQDIKFTVVCLMGRAIYKWEFQATPITTSQIRRDTDPIDVKLITAPNYGDNPVLKDVGSNISLPIVYVIPTPIWRY